MKHIPRIVRVTAIVALTVLLSCVAERQPDGMQKARPYHDVTVCPRTRMEPLKPNPLVSLNGVVYTDAAGNREYLDLTDLASTNGPPVDVGKTFKLEHGYRFQVAHSLYVPSAGGGHVLRHHRYTTLVVPETPRTATAEVGFTTSTGTGAVAVELSRGWVLLTGSYPLSRTHWVHTVADGTACAMQYFPASGGMPPKVIIYNLELPTANTCKVHIYNTQNQKVGTLMNWQYAVVPANFINVTPKNITDQQKPFIKDKVYEWAKKATMPDITENPNY